MAVITYLDAILYFRKIHETDVSHKGSKSLFTALSPVGQ